MKNKKSFPNLFRPDKSRLIVILLLLSSSTTIAQETPQTEFPIGSMISNDNIANPIVHQTYDSTGMNLLSEEVSDITQPYLTNYNVHALNMDSSADYIYHYSTAYYSKWQAVQDTVAPYIGFKHKDSLGNLIGSQATYLGIPCWSSEGLSEPHDSLLYGPHYHQEKWYRRWLYNDPLNMADIYDVRYIPRYRMALKITDPTIDPNEDVCRIYVMVRHAPEINGHWNGLVYDDTLKATRTLKVSDFQPYGQFKYIYFSDNPPERWYRYPKAFQSPGEYYKLRSPEIPDADTVWVDINGNNGVEFRVEWLRSDAKCTLYVDFVEVYDDFGWKEFIEDRERVAEQITTYADSFKTLGWSNIKYWVGSDEPYSIDAYTPLRIVDSLLRDDDAPPLLVHLYPYWNIKINEDSMLARYYRTAKPEPLNIHFFPFNSWNVPASFSDWEYFRKQLQISYSLTKEKGFWYKLDNFGNLLDGGGWLTWRKPEPPEQKAEVMLALAHGVKGLTISTYDSYRGYDDVTQQWYTQIGLIGLPPGYVKDTLWYVFTNEIIPRLKGTLGNTLLNLDYTGDYIHIWYFIPTQDPLPPPTTYSYLTLGYGGVPAEDMHWQCGFFENPYLADTKYFFLVNLLTTLDYRNIS